MRKRGDRLSWSPPDRDVGHVVGILRGALEDVFGHRLVGLYAFGSLAWGDYTPGVSDVDFLAVVAEKPPLATRRRLVDLVAPRGPALPVAGLDFELLDLAKAQRPPRVPASDLALGMYRGHHWKPEISYDAGGDPSPHLAAGCIRETGAVVTGRPAPEVFADVPRPWLIAACAKELRWWLEQDPIWMPRTAILNASRAWRYVETGELGSKQAGGEWALARIGPKTLIEAALAVQRGHGHREFDQAEIRSYVASIERRLVDSGAE